MIHRLCRGSALACHSKVTQKGDVTCSGAAGVDVDVDLFTTHVSKYELDLRFNSLILFLNIIIILCFCPRNVGHGFHVLTGL